MGFLSSQKSPFPSFPPFLFSLLHHIPVLVKALIVNSAKKKKKWEYLCSLEPLHAPCRIKEPTAKETLPRGSLASPRTPTQLLSTLAAEGSSVHGKACEESAKAELG